jgi:hypothetical protein
MIYRMIFHHNIQRGFVKYVQNYENELPLGIDLAVSFGTRGRAMRWFWVRMLLNLLCPRKENKGGM